MPEALAHEMDAISEAETGRHVPFYSCYGATETAPFALAVNWPGASGGMVGLPMQGVTLKLAPLDGASVLEARLKGPSVTPGYWRDAEATAQAFDEEGYYRYGDALAPFDSQDLSKGLVFDGRIGENFKLATGTWVNVAGLRDRLMTATKGCLVDAVIAGEGQLDVGALVFPNPNFRWRCTVASKRSPRRTPRTCHRRDRIIHLHRTRPGAFGTAGRSGRRDDRQGRGQSESRAAQSRTRHRPPVRRAASPRCHFIRFEG